MTVNRVVVLGGSAGALEPLVEVVRALPADFPAAVLVVRHISPSGPSYLPEILDREGPLPAQHAEHGAPVEAGRVYVAPPDRHLVLRDGRMHLTHGPKENRSRPSVDVLFRSAAAEYGPGVTGVVLSGYLDDGAAGAWAVRQSGGTVVVQDPSAAEAPSMPASAMQRVQVDHVLPAGRIGAVLAELARAPASRAERAREGMSMEERDRERLRAEVDIATGGEPARNGVLEMGPLTPLTCPECHGSLVGIREGDGVRFRCHTGHAFSPASLEDGLTETTEAAVWQGVRALQEQLLLIEHLREHSPPSRKDTAAGSFEERAAQLETQLAALREFAVRRRAPG